MLLMQLSVQNLAPITFNYIFAFDNIYLNLNRACKHTIWKGLAAFRVLKLQLQFFRFAKEKLMLVLKEMINS